MAGAEDKPSGAEEPHPLERLEPEIARFRQQWAAERPSMGEEP
jgi:hypothetical protein